MLDLESEANKRLGFNTGGGEVMFCYWILLFSCSKAFDANVGITLYCQFCVFVKNRSVRLHLTDEVDIKKA